MKKLLAVFLLVMLVFSLVACGSNDNKSKTETTSDAQVVDKDQSEENKDNDQANQDVSKDEPIKADQDKQDSKVVEVEFTPITVVDNEDITIVINDLIDEKEWGITFKTFVENKSENNYSISIEKSSINGIQTPTWFSSSIKAGKKVNAELSFHEYEVIKQLGELTDFYIEFTVYDDDDWSVPYYHKEDVHIYPLGQDKVKPYVRQPQSSDIVIVDDDMMTIIVTGFEDDDFYGYVINLFITNKSELELLYTVEDVSVNGYMMDPYFMKSLKPDASTFSSIRWYSGEFEENNITKVEEIELTWDVYDYESWYGDQLFTKTMILNP